MIRCLVFLLAAIACQRPVGYIECSGSIAGVLKWTSANAVEVFNKAFVERLGIFRQGSRASCSVALDGNDRDIYSAAMLGRKSGNNHENPSVYV